MNSSRCSFPVVLGIVLSILGLTPILFAQEQDIRDKVQPSTEASRVDALIDTQGVVYGVPFGTKEDEVIQKFGKPAGYIRLDAHRTALLYGQSHLLLCYDGEFDAILIDRNVLNWEVSHWLTDQLPFTFEGWHLSDGVKSGMNLKAVKEIVHEEPAAHTQQVTFSTPQCRVKLGFTHWIDRGAGDETYAVNSLLMAHQHDGKDQWSDPFLPNASMSGGAKGRKIIGMGISAIDKGVVITQVVKDSPADKAGIQAGDLVTDLNGESTAGIATAEFSRRIGTQEMSTPEVVAKNGNKREVRLKAVDAGTLTNQLAGTPLAFANVSVGQEAPDFEAKSATGATVKLSELKGSPVIVEFTDLGREPCGKQTRALIGLETKYQSRGLKILSVYLNPPGQDVFAGAKESGADWPIHTDDKGWNDAVARQYGVVGVPSSVLVGKDGKIRKINRFDTDFVAGVEEALK